MDEVLRERQVAPGAFLKCFVHMEAPRHVASECGYKAGQEHVLSGVYGHPRSVNLSGNQTIWRASR